MPFRCFRFHGWNQVTCNLFLILQITALITSRTELSLRCRQLELHVDTELWNCHFTVGYCMELQVDIELWNWTVTPLSAELSQLSLSAIRITCGYWTVKLNCHFAVVYWCYMWILNCGTELPLRCGLLELHVDTELWNWTDTSLSAIRVALHVDT